MSSQIKIINLALTHLGTRTIASLLENSEAARRANEVWDAAVDEVLRDHAWNFATLVQPLALAAQDSVIGWRYAYVYPSKCLKVRRVFNQVIFDNLSSDPQWDAGDAWMRFKTLSEDFREMVGPTTLNAILVSQLPGAYAEYTFAMYDMSRWDALASKALSFKLAAELAHVLVGKEEREATMEGKYQLQISEAKRIDESEGEDKARVRSSLVESRS